MTVYSCQSIGNTQLGGGVLTCVGDDPEKNIVGKLGEGQGGLYMYELGVWSDGFDMTVCMAGRVVDRHKEA